MEDYIRHMNAWGPQGCRENLETIVDCVMEEADKRDWWKRSTLIPRDRLAVERDLILPAIQQAENEITKET